MSVDTGFQGKRAQDAELIVPAQFINTYLTADYLQNNKILLNLFPAKSPRRQGFYF